MGTLNQALKAILRAARETEGRPVVRSLERGLSIAVLQDPDGQVALKIERLNAEPSAQEWETVLKHWPEPVPDGVVPTSRKAGRRHALTARWPRPALLGEAFK